MEQLETEPESSIPQLKTSMQHISFIFLNFQINFICYLNWFHIEVAPTYNIF